MKIKKSTKKECDDNKSLIETYSETWTALAAYDRRSEDKDAKNNQKDEKA